MAGLLDLFDPQASPQDAQGALPYAGLLGAAGALSQAAMPSRMPVPSGAAIGAGAAGFLGGMQQGQQTEMGAQGLDAARNQNAINHAMLPSQLQMIGQMNGAGGGNPNDPNAPLIDPRLAALIAQRSGIDPKNARGAAPWLEYLNNLNPKGGGYYVGQDGQSHPVPGANQGAGARVSAEEWAKLPPETQRMLTQSGIRVGEASQMPQVMKPGDVVATPGQVQGRQPAAPVAFPFNPQDPANDAALRSIQDPQLRAAVYASAQANNISVPHLVALGHTESGMNINAPNGSAGEIGPFQLKPGTGAMVGAGDLTNPYQNAFAGGAYFRRTLNSANGDLAMGVSHYNTGEAGPLNPSYVNGFNSHLSRFGQPVPAAQPVAAPAPAAGPATVPGLQNQQADAARVEMMKGRASADTKTVDEFSTATRGNSSVLGNTATIRNLAANSTTGWGQDKILQAKQVLAAMGLTDSQIPATGELLKKKMFELTSQAVRGMGAREPGSVLMAFQKNYPDIESRPETINAMTRIIDMNQIYNQNKAQAMQGYHNESINGMNAKGYRGLNGFDDHFNKENDPRVYVAAGLASGGMPYKVWSRGLSDDQVKQSLKLAGSVYPDARVLDAAGKPHTLGGQIVGGQ